MHNAIQLVAKLSLADFCNRHHIRRLSLFGSALREDFRPDSDVDLLIEFQPGHTPGWEIVDLEEELSDLFGGRRVDVVNPEVPESATTGEDSSFRCGAVCRRMISAICNPQYEIRN